MLQLGKTYYGNHEYESAAAWFSRIPKDDPVAGEANFLLGMSEFYRGSFEKAFTAFNLSRHTAAAHRGLQQPGRGGGPARPALVGGGILFQGGQCRPERLGLPL